MTELDFHTGVHEPLAYTCRLLRKGWRSGRTLVVCGESRLLAQLDQLLWTFEAGEFLPHLRLRAGQPPAQHLLRTPIWLTDEPLTAPCRDVLVNLGPLTISQPDAFARLIEVVGATPEQAQAGRQRWRHYTDQGLTPRNHPQAASQD